MGCYRCEIGPNKKKTRWSPGFLFIYYIGRVGIEPTRYLYRRILSPLRLPIPPPPLSENILHGLGIWSSVRNCPIYFRLELLSFATRHSVM